MKLGVRRQALHWLPWQLSSAMQVRGVSGTLQMPRLQEAPEGILSLGVEHCIDLVEYLARRVHQEC